MISERSSKVLGIADRVGRYNAHHYQANLHGKLKCVAANEQFGRIG